jgi:hypothetical protein
MDFYAKGVTLRASRFFVLQGRGVMMAPQFFK